MNKKIIIKSPAKINLTLEVIRKYKDDFHEIKSVVMNSDLHDEIVLEKSNTFEIITNSNIPQNENLIYKSYVFLKDSYLERRNSFIGGAQIPYITRLVNTQLFSSWVDEVMMNDEV